MSLQTSLRGMFIAVLLILSVSVLGSSMNRTVSLAYSEGLATAELTITASAFLKFAPDIPIKIEFGAALHTVELSLLPPGCSFTAYLPGFTVCIGLTTPWTFTGIPDGTGVFLSAVTTQEIFSDPFTAIMGTASFRKVGM